LKKRTKTIRTPARASTPPKRNLERSSTPSEDAKQIALAAAQAALDKKANGVEILDVTGKVDYADYLVLTTGQNDRHVAAIADAVEEVVGKKGWRAISVEGLPRGHWVLIDFVDVVVHVFQEDSRALYDLDGLWMDARRVRVVEPVKNQA
jgi:ribosome-associated protein